MASPDKTQSAQEMEDLSVFLIEQGLEDYEQEIRSRGVSKPSHLLRLTEADVEDIIPNKPIHARKLASLVRGRRLSSSKFTVDLSDDAEGRNSGEVQRRPSRTPTPSIKEGLSPQVKRLISARGEAAKQNARKSTQVIMLETMNVTISTFNDVAAEGGSLPAMQLMQLVDKHIRAPIDKRLTALCAMKVLTPDKAACSGKFWSKIDNSKAQISALLGAIVSAKAAYLELMDTLPQAEEKQVVIQGNLQFMKTNIPKQKRKSIFKKTGDVLKKSSAKNEEKEKEAEAFKAVVSEAAMEMQSRFHATLSDWDDITRLQYQAERNGKTIADAIDQMQSYSKMHLVEGEMDGDLQMLVEGEFQKVQDWLRELQDTGRTKNDAIKSVFNSVQGSTVNAFNQLAQNPTFQEMINDDDALISAQSYRIVVPHGAVPGSNVLRVPIVKGSETTFVDVPVPASAQPGYTVMSVSPHTAPAAADGEEGGASEGAAEEVAGSPQIMPK